MGAGASIGATDPSGHGPPNAQQLGEALADRFLGGKHREEPLTWISELAVSESDLFTVQDYIASLFVNLREAEFHKLIPTFKWRALATTNYDTVIESAYAHSPERLQTLVPFISDKDRVEELLRAPNSLPYLKLHGCITRTHDPELPLILTADQYAAHPDGRRRLFDLLSGWGHEYPIVFVGHGIHDPDLRQVLLGLSRLEQVRPRYYLVRPNVSAEEKRLWGTKKIAVLDGTFEDFLHSIDHEIPKTQRQLALLVPSDHPFSRRITVTDHLGNALLTVFENDLEYVHPNLPSGTAPPESFYRGFDLGWQPIEQDLDVHRELTEEMILEVVLASDIDRPTAADFYVIKAEAGAGKSVSLRRLAWDAAKEVDAICFYLRTGGKLDYDSVAEIYRLARKRIFLFVDNAADHVIELERLLLRARRDNLPITIIAAERINEWNMGCERIDPFVSTEFRLEYLTHNEVLQLVDLLERHNSLGELKSRTPDERIAAIEKRAGRQLLVALHEATMGKPFVEILVDEYKEIRPELAQTIYLSVCVLNRLDIPLRAGIISRVYDVPFTEFKKRFLGPLEHVVQARYREQSKDYFYTARHSEIAAIVFDEILSKTQDRFDHYVRLIGAMNLAYSSDREAFRALVKGRVLLDLFPDHTAVLEIFSVAEKVAFKDPYLFHQRGLYEMHRPNGSLDEAFRFLKIAHNLNERDTSILHSMAELERKRAEVARSPYEKERVRKDAIKIAASLMSDERSRPAARHTLTKIAVDKLKEFLTSTSASDREIDGCIQEIERHLEVGLQENPNDTYLLSTEAEYSGLIQDDERAFKALREAFRINRRNAFVATRLAKAYEGRGDSKSATDVLRQTLEANPSDRQAHYRLALTLMKEKSPDTTSILYHLRRSFAPGDRNFDSQFWYARFAFESGDPDLLREAKDLFTHLRGTALPMSYEERVLIRAHAQHNGVPTRSTGTITRKEVTYGFVQMDGDGSWIFVHRNNIDSKVWDGLVVGERVAFSLGFSFNGPVAEKLEPLA